LNGENNDQNDRLKVDSEVAAKTSEAATEVQDHHV
jgi:fibrillarin-like pre-rRNA processing protein